MAKNTETLLSRIDNPRYWGYVWALLVGIWIGNGFSIFSGAIAFLLIFTTGYPSAQKMWKRLNKVKA